MYHYMQQISVTDDSNESDYLCEGIHRIITSFLYREDEKRTRDGTQLMQRMNLPAKGKYSNRFRW
jgi:hypothetical protein